VLAVRPVEESPALDVELPLSATLAPLVFAPEPVELPLVDPADPESPDAIPVAAPSAAPRAAGDVLAALDSPPLGEPVAAVLVDEGLAVPSVSSMNPRAWASEADLRGMEGRLAALDVAVFDATLDAVRGPIGAVERARAAVDS
jgi:hypothetical protein